MRKNLPTQKFLLTVMMLLLGLYSFAQSTIFISQVADPSDIYQGRYVQIYNSGTAAVDLGAAEYWLVRQANGSSVANMSLSGVIQPGGVYIVAYSDTQFETSFGFMPDAISGYVNGNGNDGYFLYSGGDYTNGTLVDSYGVLDQDGSGEPWEYTDGLAVRNTNVCAGNTTWTPSEWTITSPVNTTDMDPANHTCSSGSDVTAPAWDDGYPKTEKVEDTRGILVVKLSEACTAYYMVVPSGSTAPTSAEVKAGTDYGSVTVGPTGSINVTSPELSYRDTITGASASTSYDIYVAAEDGSSNLQSAPAKISITTTAARSLTMTSPLAGQTYSIAETIPVTWTSANIDSLYIYVYSYGAHQLFPVMEKPVAASTGSYDLKVPPDATLGQYDFYLMDAYDTSFYSKVGTLNLVDNRAIAISKPVANQNVYVGDTLTIRWTSTLVDSVLIGGYNETQGDHFMLTTSDMDHYDKAYWTPVVATQDTFSFYLDPTMIGGNQTVTLYVYDASDTSFKATVTPVNIIDTMPMEIRSTVPTFGMTDYPPMGGINCSFNTNVKAGTGSVHLKKDDGTTVEDVDVSALNFNGDGFYFMPNPALVPGQSYYIEIDQGLVVSQDDSKTFEGLSGKTWNFTVSSSELYFSEYDEGSSNNKALEVYNPTDHDISLDNYAIGSSYNGGGIQNDLYYFPTGSIIKSGEVFVLANSQANSDILAKANDTVAYNEGGYVTSFNGNDARALIRLVGSDKNWVMVDMIGDPNNDPGTGWDVAGVSEATLNHTLLRKISVMYGTMDWGTSSGSNADNSQWVVWAQDSITNLGFPSPTATGINNPEIADKISLYPNPNNGMFRINTNDIFMGSVRVRVMDVTGRLVYDKVFSNASNISVDIRNMSSSIYFLALNDEHHSVVKKFIKK